MGKVLNAVILGASAVLAADAAKKYLPAAIKVGTYDLRPLAGAVGGVYVGNFLASKFGK